MSGLLPDEPSTRALLSLVLLAVGTAGCCYALSNRRWEVPAAVVATAGVVGWLLTGTSATAVLVIVVQGTGVHAGDLLSIPGAVLVGWLAFRGWRR